MSRERIQPGVGSPVARLGDGLPIRPTVNFGSVGGTLGLQSLEQRDTRFAQNGARALDVEILPSVDPTSVESSGGSNAERSKMDRWSRLEDQIGLRRRQLENERLDICCKENAHDGGS